MIFVGAIYGSHHFLIPRLISSESGKYYPITASTYSDETISYAPRANAAYLGDFIVGDIRLVEYKDGPAWLPILNPLIMGGLGRLAGSLYGAFIMSDILFPALIFGVLYFLVYEITQRKNAALLFSSLFIFFPMFGMFIPPVSALNLRLLAEGLVPFLNNDAPLHFSFFEEPKITFLFFATAFYCIFRALKRDEWSSAIAAGVAFGLLFYTYVYDWAVVTVALGFMFVIFLFQKDYGRVKKIVAIIGIGLTVSLFYWSNFWQVYHVPHYNDIVARISPEISHQFRFATVWKSYLRDSMLVGALWFLWWGKNRMLVIYLAGFLLSYFVVVNMQVVVGFNPQPDHWYRTQFLPVALGVFLLFFWVFERYKHLLSKKIIIGTFSLFLFFFFFGQAYSEYAYSRSYAPKYVIPNEVVERHAWLNKNTQKWSVIGTLSPDVARDISLHTHNKLFLPIGTDVAASEQEVWERLMLLSGMFGITAERFSALITNEEMLFYLFSHRFFSDTSFDNAFRGESCCMLPKELYGRKILEYVLLGQEFPDHDVPYRLDYLWVGNAEKQIISDFSIVEGFKKVYDDGAVRIYKL